MVADALQVSVRELFTVIDDAELSSRVDSLQDRGDLQQAARDRIAGAWRWLYIGVGIVLSLVSFTFPHGLVLFLAYWTGGYIILMAIRRIYLEPMLDAKYPLSRDRRTPRARRRAAARARSVSSVPTEEVSTSA